MNTTPINWDRIADHLQKTMARMVHEENWSGPNLHAEALRRTFGYVPANDPGTTGRALPYEHLQNGHGLLTGAEADHSRDTHTYFDRSNREKAEQEVREMRAEVRRVYTEAGRDFAAFLRAKCNDRTVPSKYRREGVVWAADMIDPSVPKDRYGNLRDREVAS